MTRTTIARGAIYRLPDTADYFDVSLHVTFNRETVTVHGYRWLDGGFHSIDEDDMDEDGGELALIHDETYSGYTLAECLCKSLIDMDVAEDWDEAIPLVESLGIPYVTDDDE